MTHARTTCPPREILARASIGALSEAKTVPIERHLAECTECLRAAETIEPRDALVELFRGAAAIQASLSPHVAASRELIDHFQRLAPSSLEAAGAPPVEFRPTDDDSERFHFLAPPQGADEIGRLGEYRVLRVLGEGGMGIVFEAEDMRLKRRVALKAMKPALAASTSSRKRFVREARAAASVEHDHIVPIYQVGEDRGVPFLAMPFLQGESLDERLRRDGKLPIDEVLRIGREAADGLAAAHARGLIHRDIKPGNIWLEAGRASPRVKILDFGLARANEGEANLTQSGAILGTPAYMAPEQARGGSVDARADLFSLGCVLYRALTGEPPFEGSDPLAVLAALAITTPPPPSEVAPEVPADISELVMRLLSKDAAERPATALDVLARIDELGAERLQEAKMRAGEEGSRGGGEEGRKAGAKNDPSLATGPDTVPVSCSHSSTPRNRRRVAAAAAAAFVVLAGVVLIIRDRSGKVVAEIETENGAKVKPDNGATVEIKTKRADLLHGRPGVSPPVESPEEPADESTPESDAGDHDVPNNAVSRDAENSGLAPGHLRSGSARPEIRNPKSEIRNRPLSSMSLVTRPAKIDGVESWTLDTTSHRGPIHQAEYSSNGALLATLGADGTLRLWNATTGKLVRGLVGHGPEGCFCWSLDGARLAVGDREAIAIWDVATGKRLRTAKIDNALRVSAVAWSPDGRKLATVVSRGGPTGMEIELYDAEAGELLDSHPSNWDWNVNVGGPARQCLAWSPDGGKLAFTNSHAILIWSASAGRPAQAFAKAPIMGIAWTSDARLLAAVGGVLRDNVLQIGLFDAEANELLHTLAPSLDHEDMWFCGFSVGGKTLVTTHASENARTRDLTWSVATGTVLREWRLEAPREQVLCAVAAGDDPQIAEFNPTTGELCALPGAVPESAWRHAALQPVVWGDVNPIGSAAWSPDGRTLARAGMGCVWFWDLSAGRHRATSGPTGPRLGQLAWPAGDVRACLRTGQWVAFDGVTAAMRPTVRIAPSTVPAVMSPDGSLVAVADTEQTCIHGADTAKLLRTLRTKAKFPPAWSRDGQLLATVADETTVWDVTTGEPLRTLPIVGRCEWSPDGSRLAYTIGNGALLEIRDAEQGELIATLENDEPVVIEGPRLAWSRDGKRIAGFGRIWDAGDGKLIHHLQRFGTAASSFSPLWSPDDRFVTYSTPEFSTAIADADTGEVAMTLLAFSQSRSLAVSAEGHFRASPRTDEELVYIVQTDEGQDTLSPREFDEKYEWKNDPARVGLASRPARRVPRRKPPVFQDLPPD